jgi:hypothetical protein
VQNPFAAEASKETRGRELPNNAAPHEISRGKLLRDGNCKSDRSQKEWRRCFSVTSLKRLRIKSYTAKRNLSGAPVLRKIIRMVPMNSHGEVFLHPVRSGPEQELSGLGFFYSRSAM